MKSITWKKLENLKYILRFHNAPEKYEHLILPELTPHGTKVHVEMSIYCNVGRGRLIGVSRETLQHHTQVGYIV